jgi:hypothetical protein
MAKRPTKVSSAALQMSTRIAIYILHVTEPDGQIWHYVGSTKAQRLEERVLEHKWNKGAKATVGAAARGASIELGGAHLAIDRRLEQALLSSPMVDQLCKLCKERNTSGPLLRLRRGERPRIPSS